MKRRDTVKRKREDERENEERERCKKRGFFFSKNVQNPQSSQMNQLKILEKSLWKNYSSCFFESSESDRFFNYLHDSNSIFRAGRIRAARNI